MLLHRMYLWPSVISHTKKQSVFTLCFLTKPATCCFAALLRSLSAHFASRSARISDTARRSDTEIAHFTQL